MKQTVILSAMAIAILSCGKKNTTAKPICMTREQKILSCLRDYTHMHPNYAHMVCTDRYRISKCYR